jgi:hypothetical protein
MKATLLNLIEAYERRMSPDEWEMAFTNLELCNMVRYLVARLEAEVATDDEVAILWCTATELHRRRQSSDAHIRRGLGVVN